MTAEEGNAPACGKQATRTRHLRPNQAHRVESRAPRVLHSVHGPVHVTTNLRASRSGKPEQSGGTGTGANRVGRARLAARHRSRKGESMAGTKRTTVSAVFPARNEEPRRECPYVVAVAELGKRQPISNTPPQRTPKRAAAVVNRDLARGARKSTAGETLHARRRRSETVVRRMRPRVA